MDAVQEAKALGRLPGVLLKDISRASIPLNLLDMPDEPCGFPNVADEELAREEPDVIAHYLGCDEEHAEAVHNAHLSRVEAAGSGSWGICHPDKVPGYHAVEYGVDVDSFPRHYHRKLTDEEKREFSIEKAPWWGWSLEEAMDMFSGASVLDACLRVGVEETFRLAGNAHIRVESKPRTGIWIRSRVIPGSTIGLGWFPSPGCRSLVEFHIDSSWDAHVQAKVGLFGHECGHCNLLEHEFFRQGWHKGVMSYTSKYPYEGFSTGQAPHTLPRDPSWAVLERYYDPRPVPPPDAPAPPDPPQPPAPGNRPSEQEFDALAKNLDKLMSDFRKKHYGGPPPIIWN